MTDSSVNKLKPGEMRFVDNYVPSLPAGTYKIEVEQSLEGSGARNVKTKFTETQEFTVSGPRFRLDPADIYAMYPPPNSQGDFGHDLPHIVLAKRALPWERNVFGDAKIPWLALLLFDASEILPPAAGTNTGSQGPNPTGARTIRVVDLLSPESGVATGVYVDVDTSDPQQSCQVIDIEPKTFKAVMPHPDEVRYLAHCREVGTVDEPAWYSVVVGARFPGVPAPGQAGGVNVVHLVSLDGFKDYPDGEEFDEIGRVRLVSLASWIFTCLPQGGESFGELMSGLSPGDQTTALELKLPTPPEVPGATPDEEFARRVLEAGYVPCSYQTRQGERTFAWYRGPFTPQPVVPFPPNRDPFTTAAQAMIYDPDHGLFDLSYAVAWETGRLLALSDRHFGTALLNWRYKIHRLVDGLPEEREQIGLQGGRDPAQGQPDLPGKSSIAATFMSDLLGRFAEKIEPQLFKPVDRRPARPARTQAARPTARPDLAARYRDAGVQERIDEAGKDELDTICDWLKGLYLLVGMPFNNLVPDERLLPRESIRFFYVDRNWLEAMLDGALSIGIQSSRDNELQQVLRDLVRNPPGGEASASCQTVVCPRAGLLLRSAVVSGWPGLEVRAYGGSDGQKPLELEVAILRMDRLSSDVLLCLFEKVPAWIEFNEPKQGLHFGVEVQDGEQKISLRQASAPVGKPTGDKVNVSCDEHRRLDIQALVTEVQDRVLVGEECTFGPAAFALQMVKAPEKIVFRTSAE